MTDNYQQFLSSKIAMAQKSGFVVDKSEINTLLYPHQKDIVSWAIEGGRRAIFAAFGLGKSFMQIECLRIIGKHEGGRQLIITPLGVRHEFKIDCEKLGVPIAFVRHTEEIGDNGLYMTNYESVRDGRLDVNQFNGVSLDEASVLRSYGSKTYQNFLTMFSSLKYRFVATATPSPNRYKELIHYAGFLSVMDTGQALTRFFKRDSTQANNLTIHPNMEKEFWLWVSSWAIFLQKPSDLGYSDEGYTLPKLHVHQHVVKTSLRTHEEKDGQFKLFPDAAMNLREASREKRDSIDLRTEQAMKIISKSPDDNFIIWHDQEAERHAIKKALPECKEVYGSQDMEIREDRVIDFGNGKFKYLATKPILSGSGCNFQRHCHNSIFMGIGFKFNDFIQAVHRIYRFLQTKECHIHLIYTDTEIEVFKTLMEKWSNHNIMVEKMTEIIRKYGLSHSEMAGELKRTIGINRIECKGENFTAINNDCVEECRNMPENSVDLIHTSIPFGNHYEYTASYNDFGHNTNNDSFFGQMDFLTPELLRILRPGRVAAIHVKDRVEFGNVTGYGMPSMDPFHCLTIANFRKHGFIYFGMITVVTDVVRENNQTYRLGWTENCKDGSKMGVGCPEYVLLFRKLPSDRSRAYADIPVKKSKDEYSRSRWQIDAHAFWRSSGNRSMTADEMSGFPPDVLSRVFTSESLKSIYNYEYHVKVGESLDLKGNLPSSFMTLAPGSHNEDVWHDVCRMRTLNGEQTMHGLNNHICPLQFDIVDRIISRFTNSGEMVFDPFGGIMTVPYRALMLHRKAIATELNTSYYFDGLTYLKAAEVNANMPSLFDCENINQEQEVNNAA
jgi:DNA modification methylase